MNETNRYKFKKNAIALALASGLSVLPFAADAAGLGKLNVLSGLGQPLRAEVEIGATKDELSGMTARLAPQDAFRQAGVDFNSVLFDLRFAVDKRPNGQSVIKVTSSRPINEPFMDFLIELNWTNGRLVREYTFLLDPPADVAVKSAGQSVDAKVVEVVSAPAAKADGKASLPKAAAPARLASEPAKKAPVPAEGADTHLVKPGETLRKIATDSKYEGVSLEQMLVGLFKNNPDAFVGNNVNRLKAGAILNIPEKSAVEAVSEAEAKKIYTAHAGDWNSYRQKLASATTKEAAKDDSAGQISSGKITAKVEEKVAPAEQSKDQVKVARTDAPAKGGKSGAAADDAERIAKEKALKEAQDRVALLEKSVGELQKLLELKSQKLAEVQQAQVKKEEIKPVESVKPVEASKPVEPAKPEATAKPQEETRPAAVEKPAELAKVPEEAKPIEAAPPPPPAPAPAPKKPAPPPPPPVPEPSLVDTLLEDPLPLAAGGGLLALLAGFFLVKRRRGASSSAETTAVPVPSSLGPNSVFRMTGGQSVDTGNTPPQTGDFSQTGPGAIDTDEVDPVAEADVYMAYGRDTQAEEILLEALQKDPQRTAIHAKLLEIYANRGSVKQFETLASELYAQTAGEGVEWQKVAALGARLDPANPLYSGSVEPVEASAAEVAPVIPDAKATLAMPGVLAQMAEEAAIELPTEETLVAQNVPEAEAEFVAAESEAPPASDEMVGLDFDLGSPEIAPPASQVNVAAPEISGSDALDFDLGSEFAAAVPSPASADLPEFELPSGSVEEQQPEPVFATAPDFSPEGTLVVSASPGDDVDIGVSTFVGLESPEQGTEKPVEPEAVVDFDLDMGGAGTETVVSSDFATESGTATLVDASALNSALEVDNPKLAETMVNPGAPDDSLEFDVKLTDSVFLGQPMATDFDIGSINLDLSAEPAPVPATPDAPAESPAAAVQHDAHWEEVNTKLDLAKAYEEMGDLEGARELLQEVVGEGSSDLVEQAQSILARIGG